MNLAGISIAIGLALIAWHLGPWGWLAFAAGSVWLLRRC